VNAADILAALPSASGRIEIVGEGPLVDELRTRLGDRAQSHPNEPPSAIIDTTGDAAEVVSALRRVEDLGTVVLAGPHASKVVALDLYADVHVRGLTIIGVV
jgi:hypothetical protein